MTTNDKTSNVWVYIVIGIVIVVFAFKGKSNPEKDDEFARKYLAEQRLRASLKDPDSLEIISSKMDSSKGVTIEYRARNGFGGVSVDTFYSR